MDKVALITVNYNGLKDTLDLLASLQKLEIEGLDVKTIVVDNGSSDNSVPEILEKFPKIDLVQTGGNKGFTGGFNKGLEYGKAWGADYFLLINNDTEIGSPNLLKDLIKTLEKNSSAGLVAPKIYFAKGYEYQKNYSEKDLGKVIWYGGGSFDWDNVMSKHLGIDEVDSGNFDEEKETGFISGCCFLVKKEVIEKVGNFDEKLFAYFEDNDFLERVKLVGFKLFYNGQVFIYHKVSQTAGVGSEFADYFATRNRLIFGFKYAKARTKFALFRQSLGFLITGRPMQKRGVWDFFTGKTGGEKTLVKENPNPIYPQKLSIIIVNYNTKDLTQKLLESIYQNKLGKNSEKVEVVLLDNGTLDCCEEIAKKFKEVKYLKNLENLGFSKGYNRGIKYSTGKYVLLLNSDIEVLDNSLEEILKEAERLKEAVLGGKLYYPDKSNQDSCFFLPTISGAFREYFLNQKGTYFMFLPKSDKPVKVEGIIMACFLIPRKVIDKIGLLDEGTFIFFEDIEYCRRLRENNIPVYFCPQAEFIHHHGASHKKLEEGEAYKMLVKGSKHYHGTFYYSLLYLVILFGQKFRKVIY
ncbi:MAG: glycosyltransferase family 2 protein [Candidatus Daviesbacteria bacterium]|nr:glycosyltransferase family 2 protein [Candidatus Daviesbacteria bacterium]